MRTKTPSNSVQDKAELSKSSARIIAPLFYVVLLLAWEGLCRAGFFAPYILPSPTGIARAVVRNFSQLMRHTQVTLVEILVGFLIGVLAGLALGLCIAYSRIVEQTVYPAIVVTQTIPMIALAPIFVIWLGVGLSPKVAITALICVFPIIINTVIGVKSVDSSARELLFSISASRWQVFRMVELPTALPHIFGGLQVGITLAVVGAIVGEWVGSSEGLGYFILQANSQLRTDQTFAGMFVIAALGIVLFGIVRGLDRLLLPHGARE